MAIDYADREDWEETWKQGRRPYFIHYAGGRAASQFPISRIFFDYLIEPERRELIAVEEQIVAPSAKMAFAHPSSKSTCENN